MGVVLLCFTIIIAGVHATCPDKEGGLLSWSSKGSWPNDAVPAFNQSVTISKSVLLDVTPPELFSITIENGGKLVWSAGGDYSLRVHYILIKDGGELHIGSENCRFGAKATITLLGEPGELNIAGFGEKFIGVQKGGRLELHGNDKTSWTKLVKTVPKFDKSNGQLFGHKDIPKTQHWDGVFAYHFKTDGTYVNRDFRVITSSRQRSADWNIEQLKKFIDAIPNGDIFAFVTQREYNRRGSDHSKLYDLIDSVAGANQLRNIPAFSAYALITVKGQTSTTQDDIDTVDPLSSDQTAFAVVKKDITAGGKNLQLIVESFNDKAKRWKGFADVRVLDTAYSNPIIDLAISPKNWNTGDKIFLTSTDYNWKQVEERTIIDCPSCSQTQIRVDAPFEYTHFGEIIKNVDMRGEVGLMTRNILIQGEVSKGQTNGGHVKFLRGFKSVRVEGVELTKMGQPLVLGRYPLHYHMCYNLSNTDEYPIRSYLRSNSIHHTHFRCVTIHGTHEAWLENNVCYNTFGHGFFLEDGGEKNTFLSQNLGLGQQRWRGKIKVPETGAIPTDKQATTFWITNPKTTLINNVGAGGDGAGMWFVYPDIPTGASHSLGFMAEKEARFTKIKKYENNVVHSYSKAGLFVDNIEDQNFKVSGYNQYNPKENPLDPKSASIAAVFNRLTAYKNRNQNVWMRGAWMVIANSSFSDSAVSISLLRERGMFRQVFNSVILGESPNIGEPEQVRLPNKTKIVWNRSVPMPWKMSEPRRGVRIIKGPEQLDGVFFDGFQSTEYYDSAAIMFRNCKHTMSVRSSASNVKFGFDDSTESGNWFYNPSSDDSCPSDADFQRNSVRYVADDGTRHQIIINDPFTTTSQCKLRDHWNLASCPHTYARIDAMYGSDDELTVIRTDDPFPSLTTERSFDVITGGSHNYLAVVEGESPQEITFRGVGISKSNTVRMSVCVPKGADISVFFTGGTKWRSGSRQCSLAQVDADNKGGKYFYDEEVGVVIFKFLGDKDFTPGEVHECPNKKCPVFKLRINNGDLTDSDCVSRFKAVSEYVDQSTGSAVKDESTLPSTGADPPAGWGAGSTYPWTTTVPLQ